MNADEKGLEAEGAEFAEMRRGNILIQLLFLCESLRPQRSLRLFFMFDSVEI